MESTGCAGVGWIAGSLVLGISISGWDGLSMTSRRRLAYLGMVLGFGVIIAMAAASGTAVDDLSELLPDLSSNDENDDPGKPPPTP